METLTDSFTAVDSRKKNKELLRALPIFHCSRQEEESEGPPQNP